jgi:hypothetical protein
MLPLASRPSGSTASAYTPNACPSKVATWAPVAAFQMRTVLSSLPLAKRPPGRAATQLTLSVWPLS